MLALTIPLFLVGLWSAFPLTQGLPVAIRNGWSSFCGVSITWKLLIIATALMLFLGFSSVAVRIDGDARAFYLALPKVVAASHRLLPLPGYESFTSVGLIAEMQLAALFLLNMPGATPRLFSWVTSLAVAALVTAISREAGLGKRGQLLSLTMLVTSSAVAYFWGQGKTDLFAAAFALSAVLVALQNWGGKTNRSSAVALSGLLTGFSLVAKLSYIVGFLPVIFILIFWQEIHLYFIKKWSQIANKKVFFDVLKYSCIFFILVSIPFIPHFYKNYTLLNILVDTYGEHRYFSEATTHRIILTYPFLLFFGNFWAQYGNLSPLMLMFAPLALFATARRVPCESRVVAIFMSGTAGLLAWIIIFPSVPMPRYFLATLIILFIPVAWATEKIAFGDKWLSSFVAIVSFACVVTFYKSFTNEVFPVSAAYKYIISEQSENNLHIDEVLSGNVYESVNKVAEPGARVFLATYYRFWLRPDLIQTTNGKLDNTISFNVASPEKFWLQLYEHGFTYLILDNTHPALEAIKFVPSWMHVEPIYPQSGYGGAYRLIYGAPPGALKMSTIEVSAGAWDVVSTGKK
ncbi:MAG: hypothetical protein H7240_10030 [Glaciimonas sp.]|nr:hypothetical protein [Glaciimonas sp.]